MVSVTLTIQNPTGLHTRPGTRFVKLAKRFNSVITIKKGEREFNAKSLLSLMKVGISEGDIIEVKCIGEDENLALECLKEFIASLKE